MTLTRYHLRLGLFGLILLTPLLCYGQQPATEAGPIRSSAAYAEVILRKIELQADLESFIGQYTEENPKIVDLRFEIATLTRDLDRIFAVRPSETSKLTAALGKIIVQKAKLEADLFRLKRSYNAEHPEVKRMTRKVEIYSSAVKEILG